MSTKLDYDYRFVVIHCAVCNKPLGNMGFYIDRQIDIEPAELHDDLMIEAGFHYEIRCDRCMPSGRQRKEEENE